MTRTRTRAGQLGVIYMLHFEQPYRHARHYVGWTEDLLDRLEAHSTGHGARLIAVIWAAGIGFTAIRISEGTRTTERAIKNAGGATRYCPACVAHPWNGHWSPLDSDFIPRVYLNPPGGR